MPRFLSWLAIAVASAFLVVATAAFSLSAVAVLAFAVSIATLVASSAVAYYSGPDVASVYTAVLIAAISAWTIVASLVFSESTVQHLALGSSLAIGGLALVGLTAHEVSMEHAALSSKDDSSQREPRISAAA
jgi:FtsH-binding integral membrane protein